MDYGKLVEGELMYFTNPLQLETAIVFNPTQEVLLEKGYKPIVYTESPTPTEGFQLSYKWIETGTEIYNAWFEVKIPPKELTDGEYMLQKFGLDENS